MIRKLPVLFSCCIAGAIASSASAQQFTVSLAPVPGQNVTGNTTILVEAFIVNNGGDFTMLGYQIDLPCQLPGKPGSAGTAAANGQACVVAADCITGQSCTAGLCTGGAPLSVGLDSAAASGTIPWMFKSIPPNTSAEDPGYLDGNGLRPIAQAACRLAGSPNAGEPPYTLPAGARRYLGTWRYRISQCAEGTFNIPYEVMNMPCLITDLTRIVDSNNMCASANFVAGALTVATGQCCTGTVCNDDGINQTCCTTTFPGATWVAGATCADPCACVDDSQCPDNFCAPRSCVAGVCVNDPAPVCPGTTACANGVCDPAANGGAGGCIVTNKPSGLACGSNGDSACDNPDTCDGNGNCAGNNEPNGTACGSPADTDCDNPDTCVGGACQPNNAANGSACASDGNDCTDEACSGGNCVSTNDNTNSCSDGDNCTGPDACTGGVCSGNAVNVDDGLVCTIDGCDPATGDIFHTDINLVGCLTDADCDAAGAVGSPCVGGSCECVENPDCLLQPRKDANGANCHEAGEEVCVDMFFGGTPSTLQIAGGSFRVVYDPTCLDFVSAVPGGAPWTSEIFEQVNEATGVIFYAVGSPVGGPGPKGSNLPGIMATFCFNKIGTCNDCDLCLTTLNPQHTRLTTVKGQEVLCAELGCSKPIFDAGGISSNCPDNIDVNSDCLRTTAVVNWPAVSFVDECDGVLDHDCSCVHVPLPGRPAIDCDSLASTGGTFPQGTFSFSCTAEDDNCNETATCQWTVDVSDQQTLDVHLQLSPIIDKIGPFTRCICFEMISACTPLVKTEVCETIEFGGPFNFPGQADHGVKVPKGKYVCIQARDRQHSLRATHFPLVCNGVSYTADFSGDPFFGGNWLIQGNLNRDPLIDILDFGTFLGQLNQNANPGQDKACEDAGGNGATHADFDGDGVVDAADYTFIQINFLANDKDDCCHDPSAGQEVGRTEVSVKQLREMGLDELVIADLNGDGLVNTDDMSAFVLGARPKTDKVNRGTVGRPTTIRGSK